MHIYKLLDRQLAKAICDGKRMITMDDATDDGRLAADASRQANGKQNSLGGYLPGLAKRGILRKTDRAAQARSKGRRGGTLHVWEVTEEGVAWAHEIMETST